MVLSILKEKNLPRVFYGETVNTSLYLLNKIPTKSLEGETPNEAWTRIKPNVDHLRVFGCLAHVKIVLGNQKKLEDRSKPMIFIGYEKVIKVYRVYDPFIGNIHLTRDVIFEEGCRWNWENTLEIQKNTPYNSPFLFDSAESSSNFEASQTQGHPEAELKSHPIPLLPLKKADQVSSKNFIKSMMRLEKKGILKTNHVILLEMKLSMSKMH